MTRIMTGLMAVAIVAGLFIGTAAVADGRAAAAGAERQGLMPEVVVTAEMPRLVVPTVEVRALRTVAMVDPGLRVY